MRVAQLELSQYYVRAPVYVLAIILGSILDLTGALHVYGLSALAGQQLATGAALLLTVVAASWVLLVAKERHEEQTDTYESYAAHQRSYILQRILTLLMLFAWLATTLDFLIFLSPGVSLPRALAFG